MNFSELPETGGEKKYTMKDVQDIITDLYHPEFGTEWNEVDGGLYLLVRGISKRSWDEGYYAGWDDCTELRQENPTPNPYED